jgi:hypothetical protein
MEKIPTAEEWLTSFGADADDMFYKHSVEEAMIEFAKLHVEATLKDVEQQLIDALDDHLMLEENICDVIENINNYSLENVK